MSQPRLSIVIPAFQEAARIEKSLESLASYLKQTRQADAEVLVVVADSSDGTAKLAMGKAQLFENFRVIASGPQVGKGRDVRTGMLEASGKYRLFMDADLATPLHHISDFSRHLDEGADVIIAVRNLTSSHTGLRKWISSLGNWLVQTTLLPGFKDTQCGFKAFSANAAEELFRRQTILGWGFDMEILAIARQLRFKIVQIPISDWEDQPDGTFEKSDVSTAAVQTLGELSVILWRKWTRRYLAKPE